jgi:isopentenyldiphosphate isomerase
MLIGQGTREVVKMREKTRRAGGSSAENTEAPGEEIGILVDERDDVVGTAPRSEIRAKNLLHRGVAIIVRNPNGEIYVHRRTPTKDVFPGMYDMVVGGMVTAGESYDEAARRELAEELGVDPAELVLVLKHRYRGDRNNAWISLYEVVWAGPIRHQEAEISWGAYMAEKELAARLGEWPFAPDHLEVFDRYRSGRADRLP